MFKPLEVKSRNKPFYKMLYEEMWRCERESSLAMVHLVNAASGDDLWRVSWWSEVRSPRRPGDRTIKVLPSQCLQRSVLNC